MIKYKNDFDFRLSGDAWYDPAYSDHNVPIDPALGGSSYLGNVYSGYTQRYYNGPSTELLDAYAFGKLNHPANRGGRLV